MSMADQLRGKLLPDPLVHFDIKYGHNSTYMFLEFGRPVENLAMNLEQLDSLIVGVTSLRESFIKHGGGNG